MMDLTNLPADVRALIFDCDGTLVDTSPLYARAWRAGFLSSGHEMAEAWYLERTGMSEHVLIEQFEAERGRALDGDEVVRVMREQFIADLSALEQIEAITSVAHSYRGRLPMAVASGGSRAIVSATLETTGLASLFDAVVTIDDVGRAKPEPDLFLEAARRIGVEPEHCLVFEDSREGLEAARRAEMRAVDVLELTANH